MTQGEYAGSVKIARKLDDDGSGNQMFLHDRDERFDLGTDTDDGTDSWVIEGCDFSD